MRDENKSAAKTLVARLRAVEWNKHRDTIHEAADAIEELTAALLLVVDACEATDYEVVGRVARARALLTKYGASNG